MEQETFCVIFCASGGQPNQLPQAADWTAVPTSFLLLASTVPSSPSTPWIEKRERIGEEEEMQNVAEKEMLS